MARTAFAAAAGSTLAHCATMPLTALSRTRTAFIVLAQVNAVAGSLPPTTDTSPRMALSRVLPGEIELIHCSAATGSCLSQLLSMTPVILLAFDEISVAHAGGRVFSIVMAWIGSVALHTLRMSFSEVTRKSLVTSVRPSARSQAVCGLAAEAGYQIVNVDSTVILERPKLKEFRLAIRESLAKAMELSVDRVSVKFKTAEKVGPVGEGRSAESQAVVLLTEH